jgi:hypothetical protein
MLIRQTFCHINVPILGHSLAKPQNQPNRAFEQRKFFKIYITRLGATLNEKVSHVEITKPQIQIAWKC